mmetsp:Transcript_9367/g.22473  ORF Transcript_9367/g.22473 Transcript_9367/m.22473 type:complete len:348 (+) Transcript_9367:214-1257(+)
MADRRGHLLYLCVILAFLTWDTGPISFGSWNSKRRPRRQPPASSCREGTDLDIRESVSASDFNETVSRQEAILISRLKEFGKQGQGQQVQRLFESYTGVAVPVFGAAMQAAYRSRKYDLAALVYTKLRGITTAKMNPVIAVFALKVFGKLGQLESVRLIWSETLKKGWLSNRFLATARIDAAAEMGDMVGAAHVLESLANKTLDIGVVQYNSAINACKNSAHKNSHAAAMFLFQDMIQRGLAPTIVTFTNLAGAYQTAPADRLRDLLALMEEWDVKPNHIFAETFLGALLQGRLAQVWSVSDVASILDGFDANRLAAAREFLDDMELKGLRLSKLCKLAKRYLATAI